ncbi:DUF192 domain-containing protein [Constantimarinum furrinae]|uniref:DUF192 domain-containing protein n=1 Tax=Constantimarinum furrinae TaxID=2562285 RepID=A0A7G8PUU7_9FLAO|nr:DUF192 domain-containing protein [Constantimarinum furrinae]QNJ98113.1 hypothetical protein ALE3EI_1555 [Constantimarinum furrinae]
MKRIWIPLVLAAFIGLSEGCKEKTQSQSLTKEVTFTKEGELVLIKNENDSIVANLEIEIADDDYQTRTGLMYRKSMDNDKGMLFIFDEEVKRGFYMKNTEFALDIIYINSDKKIVNIAKNAVPFNTTTIPSEGPAKYVLEVNAGLSDKWGIKKGDLVDWTRQ